MTMDSWGGEDSGLLMAQQEEEARLERERLAAYQAGPLPAPPPVTGQPAGGFFGQQFNVPPPPVGDLMAPLMPPAPPPPSGPPAGQFLGQTFAAPEPLPQDFVDAPAGSMRAQLEAQRQGESQYTNAALALATALPIIASGPVAGPLGIVGTELGNYADRSLDLPTVDLPILGETGPLGFLGGLAGGGADPGAFARVGGRAIESAPAVAARGFLNDALRAGLPEPNVSGAGYNIGVGGPMDFRQEVNRALDDEARIRGQMLDTPQQGNFQAVPTPQEMALGRAENPAPFANWDTQMLQSQLDESDNVLARAQDSMDSFRQGGRLDPVLQQSVESLYPNARPEEVTAFLNSEIINAERMAGAVRDELATRHGFPTEQGGIRFAQGPGDYGRPDLGQGPQMAGGEPPSPGGRLYTPETEPFRGMPGGVVEPERFQIAQLWAENQTNIPSAGLSDTDVKTGLYNAGFNSTGSPAASRAQYDALTSQGIKLPLETPPSEMPDAFDMARRGMTPQSPLNDVPAGGGTPPAPTAAEAGLEDFIAPGKGFELTDPAKARILGEGESVEPGEILMLHGTGNAGIQGDLRVGTNLTNDPAIANRSAISEARLEGTAGATGGPQATPFDAAALRRGDNGSANRVAVEQSIGRPLAPDEAAAVSRRLETPANSPEGIAERAGVGQAPTRAQALEDAQATFAQRVQDQAERFRAGNGRDMTPTEFQRMSETERMAAGIQPEQVRAGILDWLSLPRSLMTGLDLSFALRQMVLMAPSHPVEWAKSVGTGVRSMFSENYAEQVAQRIANSPFAPAHQNLYIAPSGRGAGTLLTREDQYATALLDRIPIIGAIYRPFERGNVAMINQFRADVADNFVKNTLSLKGESLGAISPATQRQINVYDNFVNRATGRGTLGQLEKSAVPLGQVFFSLRNTIAKPQVVASLASKPFTPAWNQMVKDSAGFLALGATTLYLADSAGLKVGVDPRSADFGKIRVGDQHIDIWGGWQQQARAVFQVVQGARGESNFVSGSGKESTKNVGQIAFPWIGNRASPQAGLVGQGLRALLENKTDGGPVLDGLRQMFPDYRAPGFNVKTAVNYLAPLGIQDTADALKSEGLAGGLRAGLMSFFGVGTQTYADTSNPRTAAVNNVMSNTANLAGLPPNVAAFLQDKSWNAATPKEQRAILEKLTPEERTAIEKGEQTLRDKQDIFQLNRDESKARADLADKQREALKPTADKILQDWKSGAMPADKALDAIKRVETAADKAAQFTGNLGPKLSESQGYQNIVKDLPKDKTDDQKEVDRIREIQGKYFGVYDDPRVTKPDGTKDWDKIEAAQKAIMDTLRKSDPGFATRMEFNLAKNPDNDFELTKWISKIDAQLEQRGYYAVASGGKTQFTREHPDVDALVSLKYGNPVHSEAAARILLTMAPERKNALQFAK